MNSRHYMRAIPVFIGFVIGAIVGFFFLFVSDADAMTLQTGEHPPVIITEYVEPMPAPLPSHVWDASDSAVLRYLYEQHLGRLPDDTGRAYWVAHVEAGYITVYDIEVFILMSEEYRPHGSIVREN